MSDRITIAIDTETELIAPGNLAPRMVCASYAYLSPEWDTTLHPPRRKPEGFRLNAGVLHHSQAMDDIGLWIAGAADHDDVLIVGHNIAFDMAVMAAHSPHLLPYIFRAYERGNIEDTMIRQQLIDIAEGTFWLNRKKKDGYSLKGLAERHLPGFEMSKGEDTYRMRYGELLHSPIEDWPKEAVDYAKNDAIATLKVYNKQLERGIGNGPEQAKAAFALHLMSCWGITTDPVKTKEFIQATSDTMRSIGSQLSQTGLLRPDGTKDMAKIRARVEALGGALKRTAKGSISTNEEALIASGDPDLAKLVDFTKAQKLDSVWTRYLEQGTNPATPVQPRFHCLVESGRTSCSKPNMQNPHRATGLRECFAARPGYYFVACDYSTLELCTLAQITTLLFKDSAMAEKLQQGVDLHLHFAAQMLRITYEEALKRNTEHDPEVREARQIAKAANFGYPGGMGANSFREFAKGYGVNISEEQATTLRDDWFKTWPEMRNYFEFVSSAIGERGKIRQFGSGRVRGDVQFTQACNSYFQGLAADGAKAALFEVSKRCYTDTKSPLYGSRPLMFIHDEIIMESPIDRAAEAAEELSKIMQGAMQEHTPDVPIRTTVAMMRRWYKGAEEVRDEGGRLLPWEPCSL